jgi:dTDP-4-dehydrorhamnose reductase
MEPRIVILGRNGQLGGALAAQLGARALAFGRDEINFCNHEFVKKLEALTRDLPISAVINASAYTQVDKAEGEGRQEAFRVNHAAVAELAAWCAVRDLPLVHFSTDYVFDGSGEEPHREDEPVQPLNAYGESKLAGERAIEEAGGRFLIFRTSWVYDARGKNFFNTILRLLREKEELDIVFDQVGAPTYAPHLAKAILSALTAAFAMPKFPTGIYHLCGGGETSWYGFALMIFALARSRDSGEKSLVKCQHIQPIPSSDYPLPAKRPLNSRLNCSRARLTFGVALPHWETGLRESFNEKYGHSGLHDRRA